MCLEKWVNPFRLSCLDVCIESRAGNRSVFEEKSFSRGVIQTSHAIYCSIGQNEFKYNAGPDWLLYDPSIIAMGIRHNFFHCMQART